MMNGIVHLIKNKKRTYSRAGGITREDIMNAMLFIFPEQVLGTKESLQKWDELENAIQHFKFLMKYGLG